MLENQYLSMKSEQSFFLSLENYIIPKHKEIHSNFFWQKFIERISPKIVFLRFIFVAQHFFEHRKRHFDFSFVLMVSMLRRARFYIGAFYFVLLSIPFEIIRQWNSIVSILSPFFFSFIKFWIRYYALALWRYFRQRSSIHKPLGTIDFSVW